MKNRIMLTAIALTSVAIAQATQKIRFRCVPARGRFCMGGDELVGDLQDLRNLLSDPI